jgi:hypothetical protein
VEFESRADKTPLERRVRGGGLISLLDEDRLVGLWDIALLLELSIGKVVVVEAGVNGNDTADTWLEPNATDGLA